MPAAAEPDGAPQRRPAVTTGPRGRVRLLHGVRKAPEVLEAMELASERRGRFSPQRLEDAEVLVADGPAPIEVRRAQCLELLAEPSHADANSHTPFREH